MDHSHPEPASPPDPSLSPSCLVPWALSQPSPVLRLLTSSSQNLLLLDYDGTLSPHVLDASKATLAPSMRAALERLVAATDAAGGHVAIITGRSTATISRFLGPLATKVTIAASHGFEISGSRVSLQTAVEYLPDLALARDALSARLAPIPGATVEDNGWSVTAHFRACSETDRAAVERAVAEVVSAAGPRIVARGGASVLEIRPNPSTPWNKGTAALALLRELGLEDAAAAVLCVGDDLTDEDMFRALLNRPQGPRAVTIHVAPSSSQLSADGACIVASRPTAAAYALRGVGEVLTLLQTLAEATEERVASRSS